ncbi:MAG: hypothetical protein ACMG51_04070, partial [Ginsengibacter sp.]
ILSRRSPFSPDRNHIHHFLLDLGFGPKKIVLTCLAANLVFVALAYYLRYTGTTVVLIALSAAALLIVTFVYYSRPKFKLAAFHEPQKDRIIRSHKVISIPSEIVEQDSSF